MMTKLLALLFFACACCTTACNQKQPAADSSGDKLPLQLSAVQVSGGWGYEVYVDKKLFIKQYSIPAVSGFQSFKTKDDALKIGNLVMEKMKLGKKFPTVSLEELKNAQIAMR